MRIRFATTDDTVALAHMRWDFTAEYSYTPDISERDSFIARCSRWIEEALTSGRWHVWVAVSDAGEIVSHVFLEEVDRVPRPGRVEYPWGYVTNVYTRPDWRGQGIGRNLMNAVEDWARVQHYELLLLWPSGNSVECYNRQGFRQPPEALEKYLD